MLHIVLQVLSVSAITTTIALFFCGIPICLTIRRQNQIGDISGVPFLMGFLGGSFWLRYGLLKLDYTMIIVNVVGVVFFANYCLFYLYFSWPKKSFASHLVLVISIILGMIVWILVKPNLDYLGIVCMTFNIMNFGAPLAGMGVVLKHRSVSTLPLPMCVANFLVSSQWCLYGYLVDDHYVVIPNGIGMLLAIVQLLLFVVLPIRADESSPLERIAAWFTGRNRARGEKIRARRAHVADLEKADTASTTLPGLTSVNSCDILPSLHERFEQLLASEMEYRRTSLDFLGRPPSYKSKSNSVPDIASLQSF